MKTCPFCNSERLGKQGRQVLCKECGAEGPDGRAYLIGWDVRLATKVLEEKVTKAKVEAAFGGDDVLERVLGALR